MAPSTNSKRSPSSRESAERPPKRRLASLRPKQTSRLALWIRATRERAGRERDGGVRAWKRRALKRKFAAMQPAEKPTLLTLPAEVRNKIWALTIDYPDVVNFGRRFDINLMRRFPSMPVSATVCRQMLAEVLGVFLHDTDFAIVLKNCDGARDVRANTAYMRLYDLQRTVGKVKSAPRTLAEAPNSPRYLFTGKRGFDFWRIIKWSKTVHASNLDLKYDFNAADGYRKLVFRMLSTVIAMRAAPWPAVRAALTSMVTIAGYYNEDFSRDPSWTYDDAALPSDYAGSMDERFIIADD